MLHSLCKSNEWIARDEGLHTNFAILLYHHLKHQKLNKDEACEMMRNAVDIETEFVCESLPVRLIGMNHELMTRYIRSVADHLLVQFNLPKMYNDSNPFPFMRFSSLSAKTNFFEQTTSEYSTACNMQIDFSKCFADSELVF
jgi:ribonucleoside-diphosphate reductase subunit M2